VRNKAEASESEIKNVFIDKKNVLDVGYSSLTKPDDETHPPAEEAKKPVEEKVVIKLNLSSFKKLEEHKNLSV
jgi:hypothetical protein